jgi:DNA-binding Lrp family transcriptional regulator
MEKENQIRFLELLEKDSSLSDESFASLLGLSKEEVVALRKELTKKGAILGYQAVIDWDKVEEETASALIEVNVTPSRGIGFDKVAHEIATFEEVSAVYLMSGGYDFAVFLERKSMKEISAFVFEKLATLPSISGTSTHFILRKYKDHKIPLALDEEDKRVERDL